MYQQANPNEMPGIGTTIVAVYKPIWKGRGGVQYLPGGGTIDGNNARDPANTYSGNLPNAQTSYVNVLEPGLLMGKITASGFYGASVFGLTSAAIHRRGHEFHGARRRGPGNHPPPGRHDGLALPDRSGDGRRHGESAGGDRDERGGHVGNPRDLHGDAVRPWPTRPWPARWCSRPTAARTIKTFVDEEDGIRVTDINGNGLNIQFPRVPIAGGVVNAPNIVNYPSDPALQAWVKTALKAAGPFIFSDDL